MKLDETYHSGYADWRKKNKQSYLVDLYEGESILSNSEDTQLCDNHVHASFP